jgi:hypothetical protein
LLDLDPARTAHVLVGLAVRDENELAVVQIMSDVNHQTGKSQQQPCPVWMSGDRAIGDSRCSEYVYPTLFLRRVNDCTRTIVVELSVGHHRHTRTDAH